MFAIIALLVGGSFADADRAVAATELLPNLKMVRLSSIQITSENGRRLLRFETIFENVGSGAFELRSRRTSTNQSVMTVSQRVYSDTGTSTYATKGTSRYAGDGHDHWHVQAVMTYELYVNGVPGVRRGAKTGFCFFDTTRRNTELPGAPAIGYYRQSWCGTSSSLETRTGVSVGWGDRYPANFAFQWIDITGLQAGTYVLRATVDQQNYYIESDNLDNCVYSRLRIEATGAPTVLGSGSSCGAASVTPVSTFPGGSVYDPPRTVRFQAGTHVGYRFNSIGTILDQKAYTLARASSAAFSSYAIPAGQSTNWFYVVNGVWAGYWIKDTAATSW